jgi:hypothetical protein
MKIEGVPVEFKVATIFIPIIALLPIPLTITLPLIEFINSTELLKSLLMKFDNSKIEFPWLMILFLAV